MFSGFGKGGFKLLTHNEARPPNFIEFNLTAGTDKVIFDGEAF
jgi:hypothetical protein